MAMIEPIKVAGLAEFNRNLRKLGADLPKALRLAQNEAAEIVVDWAAPRVPVRSGRARKTVKAKSTRTEARVQGGSRQAAYYPWLDFGGKVGINKSVSRQFYSDGRYIYPGLAANRDAVYEVLVANLVKLANQAEMEVGS